MAKGTCVIPDCDRPGTFARGWCNGHYKRWSRYGDPLGGRNLDPIRRFWAKVEKTEGCWLWMGRVAPDGYGRFAVNSTAVCAHRFAYEAATGSAIPYKMEIDHVCHNRQCVNPDHLRLVTHKQNMEHHSGPNRLNTSGVRGVHWHRRQRKWRGEVNHNGRRYSAGYFSAIEDAEQAVIALRNELHTHNDRDRAAS